MGMILRIPTSQNGGRPVTPLHSYVQPLRLEDWQGVSGCHYQHLVYGLLDCPALPKANYSLVRRSADGRQTILKIGRTSEEAATLNLAKIRHEGAVLGANEVHIHVMARTDGERARIAFDLSAGEDAGMPASAASWN